MSSESGGKTQLRYRLNCRCSLRWHGCHNAHSTGNEAALLVNLTVVVQRGGSLLVNLTVVVQRGGSLAREPDRRCAAGRLPCS